MYFNTTSTPEQRGGLFFLYSDKERMVFDDRVREFGLNEYSSAFSVLLESEQGIAPAFGFGLAIPLSKNVDFVSDFTMAWIGSVRKPNIRLTTSEVVLSSDLKALETDIRNNYEDNFHNRYHLFNVGLSYKF